jgi:hypothetical protein
VGVGALAPSLHAQQLASPVHQVGVGLLVGLVLLLLVASGSFAVGGLPGDLVGLLGLPRLLTHAGKVAPAAATGPDHAP